MAGVKFATRMLLPAAVLILLSVSTSAEDSKRCYWCGPLAEQVHRSQRAPSCSQELQETMCDPGYTHCAVVATSPPYVESRLCVKFYQDECYSLYCNTSKTWRMICPCQGNLCNGQNTDRENRAFATLTKIVGKNKRTKRCSVGAKKFISLTPRKKVVHEDITTMVPDTDTYSSIPSEEPTDEMMQTTNVINVLDNEIVNDVDNNIEEDKQSEQDSESEMQGDQPIEMNEEATTATDADVKETANVERETTKTIDETKINQVSSTLPMLQENKDDMYTTKMQEFVEETKEATEIPTLTSMVPTSIQIEHSVIQMKNPKDNLPPPEALQQNVTPAKLTTPTTMGTTEMASTNIIESTTHSIKETTKKNDTKPEIKKKSDSKEMDKNGEVPTLATLWELVIIMNVLIYFVL